MQNLRGQAKSVMVFSEMVYCILGLSAVVGAFSTDLSRLFFLPSSASLLGQYYFF